MEKLLRRRYTLEYKQEAVRLVATLLAAKLAVPKHKGFSAQVVNPGPVLINLIGKVDLDESACVCEAGEVSEVRWEEPTRVVSG